MNNLYFGPNFISLETALGCFSHCFFYFCRRSIMKLWFTQPPPPPLPHHHKKASYCPGWSSMLFIMNEKQSWYLSRCNILKSVLFLKFNTCLFGSFLSLYSEFNSYSPVPNNSPPPINFWFFCRTSAFLFGPQQLLISQILFWRYFRVRDFLN